MRKLIEFACEGETLLGSLDDAMGRTGLLIVSGGNELRCGAHRGMALLSQRLAASGIPVFRFDRRGIGDSGGENGGFESSRSDIAAAAAAFRAEVEIVRLVAFGNCDAGTALALFNDAAGIDALVLANPWVGAQTDDLPAPAAIRAHYVARLRDPATLWRLVSGGISLSKFVKGVRKLSHSRAEPIPPLATALARALAGYTPTTIVLSRGDATAIAFEDAVRGTTLAASVRYIDTDSHSFARAGDMEALEVILREALAA